MSIDRRAIGSRGVFGDDLDSLTGFKIDKDRRSSHYRPYLLWIENMKQNHFVATKAQRRDLIHNGFRFLVKVRDQDRNAPPMQRILEMLERLGKIGLSLRHRMFQSREQPPELSWPCRGTNVISHLFIKNNQSGGIALIVDGKVKQRCGKESGIVDLADWPRAVLHGVARIQQNRELAVGLAVIALHVSAFCAREQIPVHVAQVVSRRIGA